MKSGIKAKGQIRVLVVGKDGEIKKYQRSFWRRLFGLPAKMMFVKNHNTITVQGEKLLANWMLGVPTKPRITDATGFIQVGTGWTGNSPKQNTRCNTPFSTMQQISTGFPELTQTENGVVYKAVFPTGFFNTRTLNEICLLNGNTEQAECLAYAELNPAVPITSYDTLTIEWEIVSEGV
jgi:hypothetical protein